MQKFGNISTAIKTALLAAFSLSAISTSASADPGQASQQVKMSQCKNNQTIAQSLSQSIKNHALQDRGWRAFNANTYYDIERVVAAGKGMELRYLWRVSGDGSVKPLNKRAEKLCSM